MSKKITVSCIIVNYHVKDELFALLRSIKLDTYNKNMEIIVVDNDEKPVIAKELKREFPEVIYKKNPRNIGFGAANNVGAAMAHGEYLFFLNPDTFLGKGTTQLLENFLNTHPNTGVVAPILHHADNHYFSKQGTQLLTPLRALFSTSLLHRIWPSNPIAKNYWNASWDKKSLREVDAVPGTAFMIRKELFKKIGMFDEKFFLYFEEFDLCRRVKECGYSIYMIPKTKVIHLWGASTKHHTQKDRIFKESQEYYFRKYYGVLLSKLITGFLSFSTSSVLFLLIFCLGALLRTYRIQELFMFIGDFGWFYLSAWDMLTKGTIPLVSIPSSVVWLHQGPLATYLMACALYVGKMNPVAPALFFSLLDMGTLYFIYLLGQKMKNNSVGLTAALLYATSPLVLLNVRMPYHTAPISFFVTGLFLFTLTVIEKKKYYFWLFLLCGLVIQLELSNGIIGIMFLFLYLFYRKEFVQKKRMLYESICGLVAGISPFILYDISHHFTQTLGFPLWVINRTRLFLGVTTSGNATTHNLPHALMTIWEHVARIVFPYSQLVVIIVSFITGIVVLQKILIDKGKIRENKAFTIVLLWLSIPFISFLIHAAPGDAYFPLLFTPICLIISYSLSVMFRDKRIVLLGFVLFLSLFNAFYTLSQDYFLATKTGIHAMPPNGYVFGPAYSIHKDIADYISRDAKGMPLTVKMGGYQGTLATGGNQFSYLLLEKGNTLTPTAHLQYTIYDSKKDVPFNSIIFYQNEYFTVVKKVTEKK